MVHGVLGAGGVINMANTSLAWLGMPWNALDAEREDDTFGGQQMNRKLWRPGRQRIV